MNHLGRRMLAAMALGFFTGGLLALCILRSCGMK